MALNMAKGLIPLPTHLVRIITTKPEGVGWNDLGQRTVKGFVLHRMQGTLWGTDEWFHRPTVRALTDFGCDHETGQVIQWCDPHGRVSPWASGPVSSPYGDGLEFLERHGWDLNVVNRDQVSWEISGFFAQPGEVSREDSWSRVSRLVTAQALAHYAHDYGIPWHDFPIAPQDGFSFLRWHQEFTIGTGKLCPGETVIALTNDLIAAAKEIMRVAQTEGGVEPPPPPRPEPWVNHQNQPTDAGLAALFGTVRPYDSDGPVSTEWRVWSKKNDQFPPLIDVKDIPLHDGNGVLYTFANGLRIVWNPRTREAQVLGTFTTVAAATQAANGG